MARMVCNKGQKNMFALFEQGGGDWPEGILLFYNQIRLVLLGVQEERIQVPSEFPDAVTSKPFRE